MKILVIGDTADNMYTLKKFLKKSKIHLITFPRKGDALLTNSEEVEFFDSLLISKQVKKIESIKNNFDICLTMSWSGARVAYLAGLNYIMYFAGNDITTPPFLSKGKISHLKNPIHKKNFFERKFYKKNFDKAIFCITTSKEYHDHLKKYRKDGIRIDRIIVDNTLFNENIKPIDRDKNKFTFLSPQRIGIEKGHDIIWKALPLCKSDFEILQMTWFIQNNYEEEEINKKLIENKPPQVKFIPLVKRKDLGRYIKFADAVLGQLKSGIQGSIERDSAYCKKPVICYTDQKNTNIIDGNEIIPPFLPKSNKPEIVAELIDKIVESKKFRDDLIKKQYEFVHQLCDPEKVVNDWEQIFSRTKEKCGTINRKLSIFEKFENSLILGIEKIYIKKFKEKNIRVWGQEEYERLIRD
jgi:glycosyltransferase involved in cell wall biosynthesis